MIAASIVTYNTSLDELSTCLDCLRQSDLVGVVEIIDNSRSDTIREYVSEYYPDVVYTPSDNVGYGAANNISIRKSLDGIYGDISYHLVLNSDVSFEPHVIETLVRKLEADSTIGLIMPSVKGPDNKLQSCCHPLPTPMDLLKHRFVPEALLPGWRRYYDLYPVKIGHDINVPYMHGCFMLFRLSALNDVGLFDERFFMYPEDIDITRRMHSMYKTIATPDVTIFHLHRAESRKSLRMLYVHASNMLRYFAKWGFIFDRQRHVFNRNLRRDIESFDVT